jgi:hypothetical protein
VDRFVIEGGRIRIKTVQKCPGKETCLSRHWTDGSCGFLCYMDPFTNHYLCSLRALVFDTKEAAEVQLLLEKL